MNTKTPIMVLQEYMARLNKTPFYEFLEQKVPGEFECSVHVHEHFVVGKSRTKKEAKQNAAELMLKLLQKLGLYVPSQDYNFNIPKDKIQLTETSTVNYVGKLHDLCLEYCMPIPVYECLSESGPPHAKMFTLKCTTGSIERTAIGSTKKNAKQLVAGLILEYFKNNVPTRVSNINESEELLRVNEIALSKYYSLDTVQKPNLGLPISQYHLAFKNSLDKYQYDEVQILMSEKNVDPIEKSKQILEFLNLSFTWSVFPSKKNVTISFLSVPHASPPIGILGCAENALDSKVKAANEFLRYMKMVL